MKRLMLFAMAAMLGLASAYAQVTQGRVGTGDITIYGTDWTDVYGLDFDNDGTLEIRISDFESTPTIYNGAFSYGYEDDGTNILADENVWDYVGVLDAGVTVGAASASLFAGYGDAYFDGTSITLGTHYLGLRIKLADGLHYGWAEFTMTQEGDDYRATFNSCYYNATVGADIVTGDTGNTGGNECLKTIPFAEDFESISSGLPECWSQEASNLTSSKWDFSSAGHSGNCVFFEDWSGFNSRLILPVVDCSALGANAQLSFYFKNPAISNGYFANLEIYYRTSESDDWTVVSDWSLSAATEDWTSVEGLLPESAGADTYQVSFLATGVNTYPKVPVYLDDVTIGEAPSCLRPSNMAAVATDTSLVITWVESGSATDWQVKIGDGEWENVSTNPTYTAQGLSGNTDYTVSVRANCGGEQSSEAIATFRTACGTQTLPYVVDFESYTGGAYSGSAPECWQSISGTNFVQTNTTYASSGSQSLHIQGPGVVATDALALNGRNIDVTFSLRKEGDDSGYMLVGLAADYDDLSTAVWQDTIKPESVAVHTEYEFTFTNSEEVGYIVFKQVEASSSWYYWLDDLRVTVASDCQRPASGSIDNIAVVSADIAWDAVDGATEYKVAYGTANDPEVATVVTSENTSKTLTGLHAETTYYVWVATVCGASQSSWRSVGSFTTQIACAQVVDAGVTNTSETAIALGWTIDNSIGYTSTEVEVAYKENGATEWITANTTDNFYFFTGLTEGTSYNFRLTNICDNDTATAVTLTASTSVCGEISNGSTVGYIPSRPYYKYSYTQAIYPESEVAAFGDISGMSFYYNGSAATRTVDVYIADMDNPSFDDGYIDISEFTQVATDYSWSLAANDWSEIVFDAPFSHVSGKSIVIAVNDKTGGYTGSSSNGFLGHAGSGLYLYVDGSTAYDPANPGDGNASSTVPNVRFNTTCNTSCTAPIAALASVSQHEATVNWTALGSETSWTAEYRVSGATDWTVADDNITGASSYTFTGLSMGTGYEFRIGAICGEDHAYSSVTAVTACGIFDVPYAEDFNSGELSPCWVVGENAPYINNGRLYNYYYTNGYAILPEFSSAINTLRINFDAEYTGYSTCTVQIGVVDDQSGIGSFELVETVTITADQTAYEVMFNNYTGSGRNIAIKLPVGYVYIDNLVVSPIPSCLAPTAFTVDAATPVSADISWTHDTTSFEIRYRQQGGDWQTVTSETASASLTGLTPSTDYEVEVRAICNGNDSSEVLTGAFTTDVACADVTALSLTEATTSSITIGWTIDAGVGYASTLVLVGYKEADASEWSDTVTTANSFTLDGIGDGVTYNFRVRNICGADSADFVTLTASSKACGEVADGSTTIANIPTNVWYKYSYSQAIYTAAEVGDIDTIRGVSYNYNGTGNPTRTVDVYMANVESATFSGSALDISLFTQVASNYEWTVANGWSEIVFDTPFIHESGKDIVVAVDDNTASVGSSTTFQAHSGSGYSYYDDYSNIDPENPSASSSGARTSVADIRFTAKCVSPEQPATCDVPADLAASNVTATSASISWNGSADQYEVEINGQTPFTATSPYSAQGLTASTDYTVRVRALCDGDVASDWTDALNFTTLDEGEQPASCDTPTGLAVADIAESSAVISWNDVELPATDEGFVGEWNLTMAADAQIHRTVTLDATLHTMLGYMGRDMDDIDEDASIANAPMPVTIEQAAGDQVNVSGSFSVELMDGIDPITFDFSTTGTLSASGLSIEPADLTQSITLLGTMPVDLTGTATFVQPTALPENGILTLEIASLDVNGTGSLMGGTATLSITGSDLQASGAKDATATGDYPQYELEISSQASGDSVISGISATSYTVENLTASTEYSVRVRTLCDANTTSDWSAAVPFTTLESQQPQTCDVPTDLAANNVTATGAAITWTGTAPQYEVEINGQTVTVSANSYDAQSLTAATAYSVRVRALCDGGLASDWTTAISFSTPAGGDEPEPCATPVDVAVSAITANSAVVSWQAGSENESFDGEWNLVLADNDSVHMVITPDQGMHTMLQYAGYDIDDVDENVPVAGTLVPVTIEPATGNQMNITGSFDMDMYGVDDPVTFHFATTGTVSNNTMTIAPAEINETVYIMNAMPIDYTGTVTFVQPTALPVGGNLTIGIASLDISGYGDTTVSMGGFTMSGSVTISMTGSQLHATGPRANESDDSQLYELVLTNTATGVETTVNPATSPYTAQNLTPSTTYTVKVRTLCDGGSTSEWTAPVPFTTLDQGQEPESCDVPTNVDVAVTATTAEVSWTGTASEYEIEVSGAGDTFTFTVSASPYTVEGLAASTNYTVRVRALCDNGLTSDWSSIVNLTTLDQGGETDTCDMPTNLAVSNLTMTSATITWSGEATSYEIDFRNTSIVVYENSYDAVSLTPATTYTIRVRAICEPGVTSDWSEFSFTTLDEETPQGIDDVVGNASERCTVSIYPNPATSQTTVSVDGLNGKAELCVIDMSGRNVMATVMNDNTVQLDISRLAAGTYFVRISGEGISATRKLVVR